MNIHPYKFNIIQGHLPCRFSRKKKLSFKDILVELDEAILIKVIVKTFPWSLHGIPSGHMGKNISSVLVCSGVM